MAVRTAVPVRFKRQYQESTVAGVNEHTRADQRPDKRKIRQADDGLAPGEQAYQTMGAGGLDVSDRGAATADAVATGGRINEEIGGARSTGGMPMGTSGSDIGEIATTAGRGTGTYEAGRSGDVTEAGMSEEGGSVMGSVSGSGASVGGGAASSGGSTAPIDPTPARRKGP
jgi:hypothetical protein